MRKTKYFLASLLLAFLAIGLVACGDKKEDSKNSSNGNKEGLEKVTYAVFDGLNGMAVRFGHAKGFFEDEGIDLELVVVKDEVAALTTGDVDIADASTTKIIIGAGKGAPLKIVSSMYRTRGPFYLIAKPEIKSVEDLKGKNVGIALAGSGMEVYTRKILEDHKVSPDDVNLINNGLYQQGYASLQTGQVDATIIHEPFVTLGEATGDAHLLALGWEYLPDFHTGVLATNNEFAEKHPELITKVLKAYLKSQTYAKEHIDEYVEFVLQHVEIEEDVLRKALEREDVLWENKLFVEVDRLKATQKLQYDLGFQDELYDIDSIVDNSFIPENQEE